MTSWKCTNSWYIDIFIWQFFFKRNYVEIIYRIKPTMKNTQNHIYWNSSKVKFYHSNMLFIFLWVQGYKFCTIWINRLKDINFTRLNISRLNLVTSEKSFKKVSRMKKNFLHESCRGFNYELNARTTIKNRSLNWEIWNLQILLGERASTKRTYRSFSTRPCVIKKTRLAK
jgi:hypothetical protein